MGLATIRHLRLRLAIPILFIWIATVARSSPDDVATAAPVELIVVDSPEQAHNLINRLSNGEDFSALARQYSVDPTANSGGYLGVIQADSLRLELREALQRIKPGELSEVVHIPAGYAILKILKEPPIKPSADLDSGQQLAVKGAQSARLALDISGYGELDESIRNRMPTGAALRSWQMDQRAVCETRQGAPRDGIRALQEKIVKEGPQMDSFHLAYLHYALGQLWLSQGHFDEAIEELEATMHLAQSTSNDKLAAHMDQILGVAYLHRSVTSDPKIDPAVNRAFLFPSHPGPPHTRLADAQKAVSFLTKSARREPDNGELRWLVNLSYMTADLYPSKVPADLLIPPSAFESKEDIGWFPDVAPAAGLAFYCEAGGAIMDDFDNDGFLDLVTSQVDDCAPLRFMHNNGDGTFTDRAAAAGLSQQLGGLNIIQADYNNDGCIDILVLRGGWEFARHNSLLRNNCDGTFTDVTEQAGLLKGTPAPAHSAVWADIDNDGNLDLFIANENAPSQLFRNNGNGTFTDISHDAGIDRTATSKGVVSADYDNDGFPDFYVSNFNGADFLYHNNGNRTFTEVSKAANAQGPWMSFAAWFFDYDNDGKPDLFVTGYYMSVEEVARSYMGLPGKGESSKLFRNLGNGKFEDVTAAVGLNHVYMPMGANFGDIDNDGYLDIYLATGTPSFSAMFGNVLLHNQAGRHFTDISASSGTGAMSKGHGVAFGDLNNDGAEELFVVMGGPEAGDHSWSRLFANPNPHANDWINVRLTGVKSNRSAIGARIAVTLTNEGQNRRMVWRTVGSGGSFGSSPLEQHIGLGKSAKIEKIEVFWPTSGTKQTFENVRANQFIEIKEFQKTVTTLSRRPFRLRGLPTQAEGHRVSGG